MKIIFKKDITEEEKKATDARYISYDAISENFGRIGSFGYMGRIIKPKTKNRVAQVCFSRPYKLDFKSARWNFGSQFEMTLAMSALSVALLKDMKQEVVLYTDSDGAEMLKDIGYDRIYNVFDPIAVKNDFWACGKVLALDNEPLDSILIDNDIFLYDGRLLDKASSMPVCGSHHESTAMYKDILKFGQQYLPYLSGDADTSTNTGFMKIANIMIKKQFISAYWKGVNTFYNDELLQTFKMQGHGVYNIDLLIEQFSFHKIVKPEVLIKLPEQQKDAQGFVHLISFEKYCKLPVILDILKKRYPKSYRKVIKKWLEMDFSVWVEDRQYTA